MEPTIKVTSICQFLLLEQWKRGTWILDNQFLIIAVTFFYLINFEFYIPRFLTTVTSHEYKTRCCTGVKPISSRQDLKNYALLGHVLHFLWFTSTNILQLRPTLLWGGGWKVTCHKSVGTAWSYESRQKLFECMFWGFHGYEIQLSFLGQTAASGCGSVPKFRRPNLSPSSGYSCPILDNPWYCRFRALLDSTYTRLRPGIGMGCVFR